MHDSSLPYLLAPSLDIFPVSYAPLVIDQHRKSLLNSTDAEGHMNVSDEGLERLHSEGTQEAANQVTMH